MAHAKVFWTPDDDEIGSLWRLVYQEYLSPKATIDGYERLLLNHNEFLTGADALSTSSKWVSEDLLIFRTALHTFEHYRSEVFDAYHALLRKRRVPDPQAATALERAREVLLERKPFSLVGGELPVELFDPDVLTKAGVLPGDPIVQGYSDELQKKYKKTSTGRRRLIFSAPLGDAVRRFLEIENFADVAKKTWSQEAGMEPWYDYQFGLLANYYECGTFGLKHDGDEGGLVDPKSIEFDRQGVDTGFAGPGLAGVHNSLIALLICDFVDELLLFNRHHSIKGSAQCVECGQMFPRSFYGHGQKYCSAQCKDRAKKRRSRGEKAKSARRSKLLKK